MSNTGAKNYRELRVWDTAREVKRSIYDLVDTRPFDRAQRLREQLREAAATAVSQISEGYGRFDPGDLAAISRWRERPSSSVRTTSWTRWIGV